MLVASGSKYTCSLKILCLSLDFSVPYRFLQYTSSAETLLTGVADDLVRVSNALQLRRYGLRRTPVPADWFPTCHSVPHESPGGACPAGTKRKLAHAPHGCNAHTSRQPVSGSCLMNVYHYLYRKCLHLTSQRVISDRCTRTGDGHIRHPICGDARYYVPPFPTMSPFSRTLLERCR